MKKLLYTLLLTITLTATAQEAPNNGFLPSRVTTAVRNAFVTPATGLIIFNTSTNSLEINEGTGASPKWTPVSASGAQLTDVMPTNVLAYGTSLTTTATPHLLASFTNTKPGLYRIYSGFCIGGPGANPKGVKLTGVGLLEENPSCSDHGNSQIVYLSAGLVKCEYFGPVGSTITAYGGFTCQGPL